MRFFLPQSPRLGFALIAIASSALVGAGLLIGEWMRLNPCPLCIFQRVLYLMVALWAIFGVLLPGLRRLWALLMMATAAGGMATAIYQTWMQLNPEKVSTVCGGGEMSLIERLVDWLGMQWPFMFMATGFCTSKESIFGLTMANWSIPCFLAFLVAGLWVGFHRVRAGYFR